MDGRFPWLPKLTRKAVFQYPIPPAPRTAVLVPGFRSRGSVRIFPAGWGEDVAKFVPQAIAAALPQLDALAGVVPVTHAVVVFRSEHEPRLGEAERKRLWWAFRVPAFEQVIGEEGVLLASECEAHNGLHIIAKLTLDRHAVDSAPCGCGRTEPRLISVEPVQLLRRAASSTG